MIGGGRWSCEEIATLARTLIDPTSLMALHMTIRPLSILVGSITFNVESPSMLLVTSIRPYLFPGKSKLLFPSIDHMRIGSGRPKALHSKVISDGSSTI